MDNLEEKLAEERKRIQAIIAPEDMESRLRNALNNKAQERRKQPKRFSSLWKYAAVAMLSLMLIGYNYNAFAYYGKKLLGFDDIISGTLQELNEQGLGQAVDKSAQLIDGAILTIDGIMTDANQTIIYYTLSNDNGLENQANNNLLPTRITGFLTNLNLFTGVSMMNESQTELKGTWTFDSVSPFAKKLTLHFREHDGPNSMKEGSISFPYNPNKALQTQLKQSIRETVTVDRGTIRFQSISATPTSTVIEGKLDVDNFDRLHLGLHGIKLIANGEAIDILGSSVRSGTTFEITYDALPEQIDSLYLAIEEFIGYADIDKTIPLAQQTNDAYSIGGNELWIYGVETTSRGVEITFATEENVLLDNVSIMAGAEQISLRTTINHTEIDAGNDKKLRQRTMVFDTSEPPSSLYIGGVHYIKPYNIMIDIVN
ncbi:DUF4179 domain-containing protein [Desulfuribacillus alkaliarsenatis]|uniref:DUF4179 domain-containing protein n=1 Tax=Desulfuribacillus alkaliarsenatis TaxID=766136 RepID=A0A1E5FYW5_9FIRM|nr:DUF4179 domain-containing protein [Desulfuribacillus alkaliarsenatis]OEF95691.1 hypothetical protein BHF68_11330 [Desulfuribacillus alkaliarsenatis]